MIRLRLTHKKMTRLVCGLLHASSSVYDEGKQNT